uniref:Coiled-coil domain-containing protein n=1 Tax=Haptolina ericina TaxID=156174 RepID=A0A7S3EYD0_9EUKA|mmetsp:Transcript_32469/g.73319  ORF Transcript_32469/g.73319 Transcript_32469/m.73319 type:complete len:207 (+) Transcript_32469:932-1552(+)
MVAESPAVAAAEAAAAAERAAEEAAWAEGGKKGNKKKESDAEKKEAKASRKAEADEQLRQEEADMSTPRSGKKKDKGGGKTKLTQAEIAAKAMAAIKAKEKEEKQRKIDIAKSGGDDYIGVLMANDNKTEGINASGMDEALAALSVGEGSGSGGKVNLKAAYLAFEERELVRLKEEKPGLKLSQYKELAHKNWQKSSENPSNQGPP